MTQDRLTHIKSQFEKACAATKEHDPYFYGWVSKDDIKWLIEELELTTLAFEVMKKNFPKTMLKVEFK